MVPPRPLWRYARIASLILKGGKSALFFVVVVYVFFYCFVYFEVFCGELTFSVLLFTLLSEKG